VEYLVTWVEGDEVEYRIISPEVLAKIFEEEKNYIIVPLH